jgi:hypothetical protein
MMLVLLVCYFIPAIVASCRHHDATGQIIVLNIFLGWTFTGWVIALVWASTNDLRKEPRGLRAERRAWVRRTPAGRQPDADGNARPARNPALHRAKGGGFRPNLRVLGAHKGEPAKRRCCCFRSSGARSKGSRCGTELAWSSGIILTSTTARKKRANSPTKTSRQRCERASGRESAAQKRARQRRLLAWRERGVRERRASGQH